MNQYECKKCGRFTAEDRDVFKGASDYDLATCPTCGGSADFYWESATVPEIRAIIAERGHEREKRHEKAMRDAETEWRRRVEAQFPEIHRDVNVMADIIRELVAHEPRPKKYHAEPTKHELDVWAASSAHLYNNPTFDEWLLDYRSKHPIAEIELIPNPDRRGEYNVRMFSNGAAYLGKAFEYRHGGQIKLKIRIDSSYQG
jgi:hypothetical protein